MLKTSFNKSVLTIAQQLQFLSSQGLIIDDEKTAEHALLTVGYYRLSGYSLPFKLPHKDNNFRKFKPDTRFNQIWQLYQFDQELKLLVMTAIEKIEITLRAAITNATVTKLGAFWYIDEHFYKNKRIYENLMHDVKKIIKNKHEVFIEHFYDKYNNPEYPPIWMVMETLSFGSCSKLFANLKRVIQKKKICEIFDFSPTIMDSWLETIVYVRNICAHHARLWNRWLVNAPIIPKSIRLHDYFQLRNRRFIVCAYILDKLLYSIDPSLNWKEDLYNLFNKYENCPGISMGFSKNWKYDPFWQPDTKKEYFLPYSASTVQ